MPPCTGSMTARPRRRSRRRFPAPPRAARSTATSSASACSAMPPPSSGWSKSCIRWSPPRRRAVSGGGRAQSGAKVAVLDMPLLFETGGDKRCDAVVVVSAPAELQRARAFERPGMTEDKLPGDPRQADAGRGKARPRRFRGGYVARFRRTRAPRCVIFSKPSLRCRNGGAEFATERIIDARNRPRHRNHRARPEPGPPPGRARLHRAAQPHSDRRDLPRLSQSGARGAGRGLRHPRAGRPSSSRTSRGSPTSPTISSPSSATRRW